MLKTPLLIAALAFAPAFAMAAPLNIVGTGDGTDMLSALAADYNTKQSDVTITVPPSIGSGGGITAVGSGTESLARIARPLKDVEAEKGIKADPIAKLPAAVYVNKGVGISGLTADQLAQIFNGTLRSWKEAGGSDLPIRVVRREEADSTLGVLRQSMPGWKEIQLTDRSKLAMTTQEAIETAETVEGAVGFGPYTKELEKRVTVLKIDGLHPTDSAYPSSVVLAAAYKDAPSAEAKGFLDYLKSDTARSIMVSFGALPLTAAN